MEFMIVPRMVVNRLLLAVNSNSTLSGGSRIFEKGGRGNGKVTLGLLRLNINV